MYIHIIDHIIDRSIALSATWSSMMIDLPDILLSLLLIQFGKINTHRNSAECILEWASYVVSPFIYH